MPDTEYRSTVRLHSERLYKQKAHQCRECYGTGQVRKVKKDGTPFIMYWRVIPAKVGKNTKVWIAIQREGSSI